MPSYIESLLRLLPYEDIEIYRRCYSVLYRRAVDEGCTFMMIMPDPSQNQLLAALPADDWRRMRPQLQWVEMTRGQVLYEAGAEVSHVYFPSSAIVSLLSVMENGASVEVAAVGGEGFVGFSAFMGGGSTMSSAVVLCAGYGLRMPAQAIAEEFNRSGAVMQQLLRHTQTVITHMAQAAACNRHHALEQQVCRWLLLNFDRLRSDDLTITHERIGHSLGVRRESVTETALRLQRDGVISYGRGRIEVVNRLAMQKRSCECYGVLRNESARLLPEPMAA